MQHLPPDPLELGGVRAFAEQLRRGEISALVATDAYLARIEALDPALRAYEHVAVERARAQARAIDALLAAGTDLGPLMGVPVAIKDIFAVAGMPTTAGSNLDVTDLIGPEGSFVRRLRRLGCVILGKLKTVEFALGASGTNQNRGAPRNPWDAETFRVASGSSSGPGVAMAAGLCGFAIGSDTGGSVRGPAAFCGVVGVKTTAGLWPLDGAFSLSRTLDTIGLLTRSAEDAAALMAALMDEAPAIAAPLKGLRLARPKNVFFDNLDDDVRHCMERALTDLSGAGVEIVEVDLPEFEEHAEIFPTISRSELIAAMGRERFLASRERMNADIADRAATGLSVSADQYIRAVWRQRELSEVARAAMRDVDGWVAPAKSRLPPPLPRECLSLDEERELDALCSGPTTRVVNVMGLSATSHPIQHYGAPLPVGLQVICGGGEESRLMSIALALEGVFGPPPRPDLRGFLKEASSAGGPYLEGTGTA